MTRSELGAVAQTSAATGWRLFHGKKFVTFWGFKKRGNGGNPFSGSEINPFTFWGNGGNPESGYGKSLLEVPKRPRKIGQCSSSAGEKVHCCLAYQPAPTECAAASKLNPFRLGRREMEETLKVAAM